MMAVPLLISPVQSVLLMVTVTFPVAYSKPVTITVAFSPFCIGFAPASIFKFLRLTVIVTFSCLGLYKPSPE